MNEMLKALYDRFYTPPEKAELRLAVGANRTLLHTFLFT